MTKLKAFSLIEMSLCLIIMSLFISMSLSTIRTLRHYIRDQKYEMILDNAQANLIGYFKIKNQFPLPEEPLTQMDGVIKGGWPSKILGKLSAPIEYYVDERLLKHVESLLPYKDNRQTLMESEFMIPFILKINNKMVYLTSSAFMIKYCPSDLNPPEIAINPASVEFEPN